MSLSRRELLIAAGAAATGASLVSTGCTRAVAAYRSATQTEALPPQVTDEPNVRFLNRYGFGPSVSDLESVRVKGQDEWFESQLAPEQNEPFELAAMVGRLEIEHLSSWELRDWPKQKVMEQMHQKAILLAVYSPWQLRERLIDFWSNHFCIYANKGLAAYRKPLDERLVIRKNVFGKFSDMLRASAESTAMLVFLDQQNSTAAHPNENYARELLELHTLGVKGGYTQKDVMEVARCFTGWTEERGFLKAKGRFVFDESLHDKGEKIVLGHRIPAGGGVEDGHRVLEIIANHPSTAKYIASKLCEFFLAKSEPAVEAKIAETFLRTKGDLKEIVKTLYSESKAIEPSYKVKRPFDYIVSALRATGANTDGSFALQQHLRLIGQPLYEWPMPDGYPVADDAWVGTMLARWKFAIALSKGEIEGTSIDLARLPKIRQTEHPVEWVMHTPQTAFPALAKQTASMTSAEALALAISSPAFQWH